MLTVPRWVGVIGSLLALSLTLWAGYILGGRYLVPKLGLDPAVVEQLAPTTLPESSIPTQDPAQAATAAAEAAADAAMPKIQIADAVPKLGQPSVLFVDTRTREEFASAHIKGAAWIVLGQLEARLEAIPKETEFIFYCACNAEQTSARAARFAKDKGFTKVSALAGGWNAWQTGGHPVESGAP